MEEVQPDSENPIPQQQILEEEETLKEPFWKELHEECRKSKEQISPENAQIISQQLTYRQERVFNLFSNNKEQYLMSMWVHLSNHLNAESPYYEPWILELLHFRENIIFQEIKNSQTSIEVHKVKPYDYQTELKNKQIHFLHQQSTDIRDKLTHINQDIQKIHTAYIKNQLTPKEIEKLQEQKIKDFEEFIKREKKEKEERIKNIQENAKKEQEEEIKRQEIKAEQQKKLHLERKEELVKNHKENEEKREKEKQVRLARDKEYQYISKSFASEPPLFKKIEHTFINRYESMEKEKKEKNIKERHSMFENIDIKSLEEHEKRYEEERLEREKKRKERLDEQERIMELQQEEIHTKYKSTQQMQTQRNFDPKIQETKIALEKRQKVKKYYEEIVKEKYLPKIDQEKRTQFLEALENLQKKRVRKIKKPDGSYEYEELKPSDPRMMGLEYLEKTKQIASKMRGKRKSSEQYQNLQAEKNNKVFDYLAEMRKKPHSVSSRDQKNMIAAFVGKKEMTFDEKIKKVEVESLKLEQLAKQKEEKLKFGKFGTSQEILQHKEQIDQHYIDIINMKLKLINFKEE